MVARIATDAERCRMNIGKRRRFKVATVNVIHWEDEGIVYIGCESTRPQSSEDPVSIELDVPAVKALIRELVGLVYEPVVAAAVTSELWESTNERKDGVK